MHVYDTPHSIRSSFRDPRTVQDITYESKAMGLLGDHSRWEKKLPEAAICCSEKLFTHLFFIMN